MTPHDETIAFAELRQTARELSIKAHADPLLGAAGLVEAAIQTLDRFQVSGQEIAHRERQKAELDAAVTSVKAEMEKLATEKKSLEETVLALRHQVEHWRRLDRSAQDETMVNNALALGK